MTTRPDDPRCARHALESEGRVDAHADANQCPLCRQERELAAQPAHLGEALPVETPPEHLDSVILALAEAHARRR